MMTYPPYSHQKQPWYFTSGFLLSIGIHIVLLLQLSHLSLPDAETPHQVKFVEVELIHMATAQELPHEEGLEPTEDKPDIQEEPPVEQVKPQTTQKKVPKPKKAKKIVKKSPKPHVVKKIVHTPQLLTNTHAPTNTTTQKQTPSVNQEQLKYIRQQYLSHIMSMIKAHKSYPYSARRRHIEGDIHVSFSIDARGNIRDLDITGASSVLRSATKQAIEDALPFPQPPQQGMHSQFMMQYRLK
jgi:protein TonB